MATNFIVLLARHQSRKAIYRCLFPVMESPWEHIYIGHNHRNMMFHLTALAAECMIKVYFNLLPNNILIKASIPCVVLVKSTSDSTLTLWQIRPHERDPCIEDWPQSRWPQKRKYKCVCLPKVLTFAFPILLPISKKQIYFCLEFVTIPCNVIKHVNFLYDNL